MQDKEQGRLCLIGTDGSDSVPYIIKKDCILFGSGDSCEIRMYVDGVASKHCLIRFDEYGKAVLEPINQKGLTFLNGEVLKKGMILKHKDVITVVKRSFRFFYPSSSRYCARSPSISVSHDEGNVVMDQSDFDPEVVLQKSKMEALEKRVTFGPRLSPEEFDRNMPPASPIRRGSLPCGNLKKAPVLPKMHAVRNLFKNIQTDKSEAEASKKKLSKSTENHHKQRNEYGRNESKEEIQPRPLFSEILKKQISDPHKIVVEDTKPKNYPSDRFPKKTHQFQKSKKSVFKSPRARIHPRILAVGSTGHANSPETIVIYKKKFSAVATDKSSSRLSNMQQKESSGHSTLDCASNDIRRKENSENIEHQVADNVCFCCLENSDSKNNAKTPSSMRHKSLVPAGDSALSSNGRHKKCSNEDALKAKKTEELEKESASLLAGTFGDVLRLGEHGTDKSLKDISNAIQALSNPANVSSYMSNAFSCPEICVDVVKNLALTISMVNAFHVYNKIMSDVSRFPLCFPSTSFHTADGMKCMQKSNTCQSDERTDFQQLAWFQGIMQNFFANSLSNIACDTGDQCLLRSHENAMPSTSFCHKKRRKSRAASKRSSIKAIDSRYRESTSKNQLICYETSWTNNSGMEVNQDKEANNISSEECDVCKPAPSIEHFRQPSTNDNNFIFLPNTCVKHSPSSRRNCCSHHQHSSCIENLCSYAYNAEETSEMHSRKSNNFNNNPRKLIKNVRRSFGGISKKHKCMFLKRKSVSVSCLRSGKRLENFMKKISFDPNKTLDISFSQRSLESEANPALKASKAKASLILQKYKSVSLKKTQKKRNERQSSVLKNGPVNSDVTLRSMKRKQAEVALQRIKKRKSSRMSSDGNTSTSSYENKKVLRSSESQSPNNKPAKSPRDLRKRNAKKQTSSNCKQIKVSQKVTRSTQKKEIASVHDKTDKISESTSPNNSPTKPTRELKKGKTEKQTSSNDKQIKVAQKTMRASRKKESASVRNQTEEITSESTSSNDSPTKSVRELRKRKRKKPTSPKDKQIKSQQEVVRISRKKKNIFNNETTKVVPEVITSKVTTPKITRGRKKRTSESRNISPVKKNHNDGKNADIRNRRQSLSSLKDEIMTPVQRKTRTELKRKNNVSSVEESKINKKRKVKSSNESSDTEDITCKTTVQTQGKGDSSPVQRQARPLKRRGANQKITKKSPTAVRTKAPRTKRNASRTRTTTDDLVSKSPPEFNEATQKKSERRQKKVQIQQETLGSSLVSGKMISRRKKLDTSGSAVSQEKSSELALDVKTARGKRGKKKLKDEANISRKRLSSQGVTRSRQTSKRRKA